MTNRWGCSERFSGCPYVLGQPVKKASLTCRVHWSPLAYSGTEDTFPTDGHAVFYLYWVYETSLLPSALSPRDEFLDSNRVMRASDGATFQGYLGQLGICCCSIRQRKHHQCTSNGSGEKATVRIVLALNLKPRLPSSSGNLILGPTLCDQIKLRGTREGSQIRS